MKFFKTFVALAVMFALFSTSAFARQKQEFAVISNDEVVATVEIRVSKTKIYKGEALSMPGKTKGFLSVKTQAFYGVSKEVDFYVAKKAFEGAIIRSDSAASMDNPKICGRVQDSEAQIVGGLVIDPLALGATDGKPFPRGITCEFVQKLFLNNIPFAVLQIKFQPGVGIITVNASAVNLEELDEN